MYSVREICSILNLNTELADKSISRICFQESQIVPDCAYFCIKGETFDSHNVNSDKLRENSVTLFTDKPIKGIDCVYTENPLKLAGADTILKFDESTKYAIYEMGLRRSNQCFKSYSELVQPEVCVIINIGNSHIENFHDKNHILDEKLYITSGMGSD